MGVRVWSQLSSLILCCLVVISLLSDSEVTEWAASFIQDFRSANANKNAQVVERVVSHRWQVPHVGSFKINTDAALNVHGKVTGFGVVIRDCYRGVMVSYCRNIRACYQPHIAEAIAILEGIRFAVNRRFVPAILESDAWLWFR
ncbi:hypothetical protein Dsin_022890 [Dipteronia sinensis]|uniref:RNase H type-1 domain-containing protein n=1 Tax=Dipteronia sinensis TaxID=43782 RepID=A0AAE0A2X4_9ROSI|nr:hypothetical protein Dsin_022890 [Dipteronia sinensis]